MSTPTEPTTPQPKPADAAGLLPALPASNSTLAQSVFAAVKEIFCQANAMPKPWSTEAINDWAEIIFRRIATPHAAEAGVRAGDGDAIKDAAKEIHGLIFNGSGKREDWQYLKAKDIATNIEGHLAARHRTAAETVGTGVSFSVLREANVARQADWCPDQKPDLSFRGNELGGECGEALNVIKKLERERLGWRGSRDTVEHLAEELADVVICADLIAIQAGIDLGKAVAEKFNATSEKQGLPQRIQFATPPATQFALVEAREAASADTALVDWVEANAFKLTLHSGEAIYFDQRGAVQGFRAAINAVLPPAKGGDKV